MADAITSEPESQVSESAMIAGRRTWAAIRKYAVEVIGTFFLVFTVAVCGFSGSAFTPLAAGTVLVAMIYAGGHISGGHYNPAVTVAALWRRRIGLTDALVYWVVQVAAGMIAGVAAHAVVNPAEVTNLRPSGHTLVATAVVELLFTYALCWVVLNVATSKSQLGNAFYGLAIGLTVVAGAFAVGGISGAAFNPAVSLGAAAGGLFAWSTLWVYLAVQIVAGILAGLTFLLLNPDDR